MSFLSHLFAPYLFVFLSGLSFLPWNPEILWLPILGVSPLSYTVLAIAWIFRSLCPCPTFLIYIFSYDSTLSIVSFLWTSLDRRFTSLTDPQLLDIFSTFYFVCIFVISKIFIFLLLSALSVYLLCSRMSSEELDFAVCGDWGKDRGRDLRG